MTPILHAQDMAAALAAVSEMHTAPGVLARGNEIIRNEYASIDDIAALIAVDPALTTDVMRVSNSVAFGFSTQATNIQEAIARLGQDEVLRLIAMCVSKQLAARDLEYYNISAFEHWSETVSVALLLEAFSRRIGESAHDAYTIGILHNIGRLVIEALLRDAPPVEPLQPHANVVAWQRENAGLNYAEAGYALLRHWRFSSLICYPIRDQLDTSNAARPSNMLASLRFARDVVQISGAGFMQSFLVNESHPYVISYMLKQDELDMILAEARERFYMHQELLGMHTDEA